MSEERDERREKVMEVLRGIDLTEVSFDPEEFPVKNTATAFSGEGSGSESVEPGLDAEEVELVFDDGSEVRCGKEIYAQPRIEEAIRAIVLAFLSESYFEYYRYNPREIDRKWKLRVEIYVSGKFYARGPQGKRRFHERRSPVMVFYYQNLELDSYEQSYARYCHDSWQGEGLGFFEGALKNSGISGMEKLLRLIYEVKNEQIEAKEKRWQREELKKEVLEKFSAEELRELAETADRMEYEKQKRMRRRI